MDQAPVFGEFPNAMFSPQGTLSEIQPQAPNLPVERPLRGSLLLIFFPILHFGSELGHFGELLTLLQERHSSTRTQTPAGGALPLPPRTVTDSAAAH